MKHLIKFVVLVVSFCLLPTLLFGQVKRYEKDTIRLDKAEYEYNTDNCHKPGTFEFYRLDFQKLCNKDVNDSLYYEDYRPHPPKDSNIETTKIFKNGEMVEVVEEKLAEYSIGWQRFLIRFRPIITYDLKRQIQRCFSSEEINRLSWNGKTFKLKLYPRVSDKGHILGFHRIKINTGEMLLEEILQMKFLERTMNLLEKKMYVDSNGKMERYNVKFYNAKEPIIVTIAYDGEVKLAFGEPEYL